MIQYSMEFCKSLTLYTSESCNLQCSYCDMANHIDKDKHKTEAQKVKESLLNGEYFNTLKIAFDKLNINSYNITSIDLWGQEPTLTLKEFTVMFAQLYKELCPNVNKIFFSTNGVFIDSIIYFIKFLDQNILNKACQLRIQISFDGYIQTYQHRGISPNIIINNIYKLIQELNLINLNFLTVNIQFHNVLDKETFILYADEQNINELQKFLHDFEDIYNSISIGNTNNNVHIDSFWCGLETPINASKEDGQLLYSFIQQCNKVCKNEKFNVGSQVINSFTQRIPLYLKNNIESLLNEINSLYYIKDWNNLQTLKNLSRQFNCGYNSISLKIRYDGTLLYCQNALYGLHQMVKNDIDSKIQAQKLEHHFYPNIITDSEEIINNYLYQTFLKSNECFLPAYIQNCQLLKLLLNAKQVDDKYNDINKFMQCVFFLTFILPCPHTSIMYCGNVYGSYCGAMRLYCNGFMDLIFDNYERKNKNNENIDG